MNSDLKDRQKFRNKEYWDERFLEEEQGKETQHEWFSTYSDFRHIVTKIAPPKTTKNILVLGCGNSTLSADLLSDYTNSTITSHDYSSVVINSMRKKYEKESRLKWEVCDCRKIPANQEESCFDLIIEKGVVDALVAGSRSPWPDTMDVECRDFVNDTKNSVIPALGEENKNNVFVSISFASPMLRYPLLADSRWGIKKHTFNSSISNFEYYLYECKIGEKDEETMPVPSVRTNESIIPFELPENDILNLSDDIF